MISLEKFTEIVGKCEIASQKNCVGHRGRWVLCPDPGLNRGPLDLQSNALPTELSRPTAGVAAIVTLVSKGRMRHEQFFLWINNVQHITIQDTGGFLAFHWHLILKLSQSRRTFHRPDPRHPSSFYHLSVLQVYKLTYLLNISIYFN